MAFRRAPAWWCAAVALTIPRPPTFNDAMPFVRKERSVARTSQSFLEKRAAIMAAAGGRDATAQKHAKLLELTGTAGLVATDELYFTMIVSASTAKEHGLVAELFSKAGLELRRPCPPHVLAPAAEALRAIVAAVPHDVQWISRHAEDLSHCGVDPSSLIPLDTRAGASQHLRPLLQALVSLGILHTTSSSSNSSSSGDLDRGAPVDFDHEAFEEDYGFMMGDAVHVAALRELLSEVAAAAAVTGDPWIFNVAASSAIAHGPRLLRTSVITDSAAFLEEIGLSLLSAASNLPSSARRGTRCSAAAIVNDDAFASFVNSTGSRAVHQAYRAIVVKDFTVVEGGVSDVLCSEELQAMAAVSAAESLTEQSVATFAVSQTASILSTLADAPPAAFDNVAALFLEVHGLAFAGVEEGREGGHDVLSELAQKVLPSIQRAKSAHSQPTELPLTVMTLAMVLLLAKRHHNLDVEAAELFAQCVHQLLQLSGLSSGDSSNAASSAEYLTRISCVHGLVAEVLLATGRFDELELQFQRLIAEDILLEATVSPLTFAAVMEAAANAGRPTLVSLLSENRWRMALFASETSPV